MTPYISIIMPVYNGERFISEALESLLSQSFGGFEIILINDGSVDGTSRICGHYTEKDSRIRFIDKENEGVSKSRNRALDMVEGEYVMFVDADDIIYPNSLKLISQKLHETNVDLLRFEYKTIDEEGRDLYPNYEAKRRRNYTNRIMSAPDFMEKVMRNEYQLCFNVFKREILEMHSIRFLEGCTYNEDTLFLIHFFCHSITHLYIPHVVYGYRKYAEAVTTSFTDKNFEDVKNVFENIMLIIPPEKLLCDAVKRVGETIGKRLMFYSREMKKEGIQHEIEQYCCKNPLTIDWKLYNLFGIRVWIILDFVRRIIRKLY